MEWYDDGKRHGISLRGTFKEVIHIWETSWYDKGEMTYFVEVTSDYLSLPSYPDGPMKLSPRHHIMFPDVASAKVWCEKYVKDQILEWAKEVESFEKTSEKQAS